MISFRTVAALCFWVTLCTAQTIDISGKVTDNSGAGLSGATVTLENADISTTTGADGSFTLTDHPTGLPDAKNGTMASSHIMVQNGKITLTLTGNALVGISIHDVGGRLLYNNKRTHHPGTHAIQAPPQSTGIFIYKVNIGNDSYSFKSSPFGTCSAGRGAPLRGTFILAKSTAAIADVIAVVSEGQLNYRDSIKTFDTSGIVIRMIANAGNVTDEDGNVYQSVRIGNQVWTVENLLTTKYNDGTAIPHVTDATQWSNLSTPGYCWYNNSTSTTEHEKWGALYNWYAVNTGKLAPAGWHVPTDAEWTTLENYLIANGYNWDGTTSGNKIAKSIAAQTDWIGHTTPGAIGNELSKNNTSGFAALPSGYRDFGGTFFVQSRDGGGWGSITEDDTSIDWGTAWGRGFGSGSADLGRCKGYKREGHAVRLVRGDSPTYTISYDGNNNTDGTAPALQTKIQGVALVLATNSSHLARTGHTFAGWNTSANGSGTAYEAGSSYTADTAIVLYARWIELPTYTVTYYKNFKTGGTTPTTQIKIQGVALTLATNSGNMVKPGFTFAGWNTAANGSGTDYAAGANYTSNANLALFVKWTPGYYAGPTVTDADGNVYTSVVIGTQTWTVENLRTTKYNDGTAIQNVTGNTQWAALNTGAYCYFENNTENKAKYGALYNWHAVNTGKLAPEGWRVPTDAEWEILKYYLIANGYNWDGTTTINKIAKSLATTTGWGLNLTPGTIANEPSKNNTSGFSALKAGARSGGTFVLSCHWWSATESDVSDAYFRSLRSEHEDLRWSHYDKGAGLSVRLVQDY